MEVLVYYILFISAALIITSFINKKPSSDEKLLDNMNKLNKKRDESNRWNVKTMDT